ncbi:MAG: hypothetical protein J1F17_01690 [Oscillospiraceae bacterium]|nr:hypothetical protein [Oscillospiraceae bacterium]
MRIGRFVIMTKKELEKEKLETVQLLFDLFRFTHKEHINTPNYHIVRKDVLKYLNKNQHLIDVKRL